jgi:altronate dehydratase large subunit
MAATFLGYARDTGRAGVRNKVLLLPIDRYSNQVAWTIDQTVAGLSRFTCPGDMGRHARDRDRLFRIMLGLIRNPNVASVLMITVRADFNYPETRAQRLLDAAADCGKPIELVTIDGEGGVGHATLAGERIARQLARAASAQPRVEAPLGDLSVGIKCGVSDGTSGISGNPALGSAMDRLVAAQGTVIFSETTEIIGAEHLLAARAGDEETGRRVLAMAGRVEAAARAVGEDIRSINPIPSNIKAGITTLEEKSLGAIAKGGTTTLRGALDHGVAPDAPGLYFMDGWMAANSLPVALAAAGAQIIVLQSGGGDMPFDPPVPVINPALISPTMFMSGNPQLAAKMPVGLDFDASDVLTGTRSLAEIGDALLDAFVATASGRLTWGETQKYVEVQELWFDGPFF